MADADARGISRPRFQGRRAWSATSRSPTRSRPSSTRRSPRSGKIDILINNAGISWAAEPETMPLDKWQKVIDTNLTGTFLFSQAVGPGDVEAPVGLHHQHRVDRRDGRLGRHVALGGLRREQGRHHRADARARRHLGPQRHSRQRDRSGILSFAPGRSGDRPCRAADQGDQSDSPGR